MILRIVHMHFKPGSVEEFLRLFEHHRDAIAGSAGCRSLRLVRSEDNMTSLSTVSIWDSASDLDAYRHGALFAEVWPHTKALFASSPHAESHTVLWAS